MKLFCTLALFVAMFFVAPARAASVDPAVSYANANSAGEVAYREGWFGKGDTRLHYVEAGEGPLIIFYHGFPSNWFSWFDQMEALKGSYHVVAVDGLGAGLSAKPAELRPYRVGQLARQLDRLAKHLDGNRRFILIGHDWGAALSLAYAQAYPERLHAVVGMSAPPYNLFLDLVRDYPEQQQRSAYMQRFRALSLEELRTNGFAPRFAKQVYGGLRDSGHLSWDEAALFEQVVGDVEAMNGGMNWYRANLPAFENMKDARRWPRHNRPIKVPTLMIWGEDDQTFLPIFLDKMPDYASNLSITRLPVVGHMTPIEKSDLSTSAIMAFVAKVCGEASNKSCR